MNNIMLYFKRIVRKTLKCVAKVTADHLFLVILFVIAMIVIKIWSKCPNKVSLNNPVVFWWTSGFPGTTGIRHCDGGISCNVFSNQNLSEFFDVDAFLFYGSGMNFKELPLPRNNAIWGLYHEESPRNTEELMHAEVLKLFNYTATFSRYSNVPYPLQYMGAITDITSREHYIDVLEKNKLLDEIAPIMYLQSDCETSTERDDYVKELMKYIKVDSYGECLKNKEMSKKFKHDYLNKLNDDDFMNFVARYKFVIAIENGVCDDYVTEKLWRAIKIGVVPIYFGSPSIRDWLPNEKSAILLQDYPKVELLSAHLNKLLADDNLYMEYLEHKTTQLITNERLIREAAVRSYQSDVMETVNKFECYICEKLYRKREGTLQISIADKRHYNCPKPISALTLAVNPQNSWVYSWVNSKKKVKDIYNLVMTA